MFALYPAKDTPHIGVSFCVVHSLLTGQCEGLKQENGCESDTHAFFVCSTPHGVSAAQARRTAMKRGIVINLCLGVDFAKSEDKEFCVVYSV